MTSKAQGPDLNAIPPTTVLPLQDWLKLLASRGVDMRVGMGLAAKIYNSHNTKQRLSELDAKKLTPLIPDKESRKVVLAAIKGIEKGEVKTKKRTRDSDLLEPLRTNQGDDDIPRSLDFKEILDPEQLIPITVTTNRAPVKTAWAYTVAQRLGFDTQESLSIAHVFVHISSLKHAIMLGNILNAKETKEGLEEIRELPGMSGWRLKGKERESGWERRVREKEEKERKERDEMGSSQPWVGVLRANSLDRVPVIERTDGTWRAIEKGIAIPPSQAYLYITRAFKENTPHVMGAMKLVAASHPPEDLNRLGMHMYNEFKPEVEQWGQKGTLELAKILDCAKGPVPISPTAGAGGEGEGEGVPEEVEEMAKTEAGLRRQDSGSIKPVNAMLGGNREEEDGSESDLSDAPDEIDGDTENGGTPRKKRRMDEAAASDVMEGMEGREKGMTVEEYEALLDAEAEGGGFMEGVDIYDAKR